MASTPKDTQHLRQTDEITPLPILSSRRNSAGSEAEDAADVDLKASLAPPPGATVDPQTGAVIAKKTAEERWYVFRLDMILLIYACGSQVLKFLDQQNINNAYVSGMQIWICAATKYVLLAMRIVYINWAVYIPPKTTPKGRTTDRQFNYFQTYFNLGYALFLIPSQIIITHVRPSIWLPALEFGWGILTLFMYAVKDAKTVYALRAFMGALEASAYPGALMLLMSWYTPRELAFRLGFYQSSQSFGSLLSGALQSAIQRSLNGSQGMPGWRWMFIINGLMTVTWAVGGLCFIPDFPNDVNKWAFWLKDGHIELARLRNERFRRASNKKFTWTSVKKTFRGPLVYAFAALYPATVLAQAGYQYFTLFLKTIVDENGNRIWSTEAINAIPMGGSAITIVTVWVYSWLSDYFQTRWLIVMAQAVFALVPCIMLSVWNIPLGAKYFAYFATYFCLGTASPIFSWMSEMCPHDAEQRAFITGFSIAIYYAISSWSNVLIWPATQAPHYRVAWQTSIGLWLAVILGLCALRYVEIKYIRPRNQRIAEEKLLANEYDADNAQVFAADNAVVGGKVQAR